MALLGSGSFSPTTEWCLIINFSIFSPNSTVFMLSVTQIWCACWPGNTGTVVWTSMVALANWFDVIFIHQWISFEKTFNTLWIQLDGTTLLDPAPWRVDFYDTLMCSHDIFSWLDVAVSFATWTWGETTRYYQSILNSSLYHFMDLSFLRDWLGIWPAVGQRLHILDIGYYFWRIIAKIRLWPAWHFVFVMAINDIFSWAFTFCYPASLARLVPRLGNHHAILPLLVLGASRRGQKFPFCR